MPQACTQQKSGGGVSLVWFQCQALKQSVLQAKVEYIDGQAWVLELDGGGGVPSPQISGPESGVAHFPKRISLGRGGGCGSCLNVGCGCRAGKTYRNRTYFTQSPKCKIGLRRGDGPRGTQLVGDRVGLDTPSVPTPRLYMACCA